MGGLFCWDAILPELIAVTSDTPHSSREIALVNLPLFRLHTHGRVQFYRATDLKPCLD